VPPSLVLLPLARQTLGFLIWMSSHFLLFRPSSAFQFHIQRWLRLLTALPPFLPPFPGTHSGVTLPKSPLSWRCARADVVPAQNLARDRDTRTTPGYLRVLNVPLTLSPLFLTILMGPLRSRCADQESFISVSFPPLLFPRG